MRRWACALVLCSLCRTSGDEAAAAEEELSARYGLGAAAYNRGHYADAVEHLGAALRVAYELGGRPPATAETVRGLEVVYARAQEQLNPPPLPPPTNPTDSAEPPSSSGASLSDALAAVRSTPDDAVAHLRFGLYAFGEERAHSLGAWAFRRGAQLAPELPFVVYGMPYLLMHALQHSCDFAGVDEWEPRLEWAMVTAIGCILHGQCGPHGEHWAHVSSETVRSVSNPYVVMTNPVTFRRPELLLHFLQASYRLQPPPPPLPHDAWALALAPARGGARSSPLHVAYITGVPSAHVTYELVGLLPLLHSRSVTVSWYVLHQGDSRVLRSTGWFHKVRLVELGGLSSEEAAARMRADGVQAAVDLDAHIEVSASKPSPVLLHGAAPVVCQWLGWAGTSAHPRVQYAALDATIAPASHARLFSERLVLLPASYQANNHALKWLEATPRSPATRTRTLAQLVSAKRGLSDEPPAEPPEGLRRLARALDERPVLCSFNQLFKLSADIFSDWRHVLRHAPGAAIVQGAGVSAGRKYSVSDGPRMLHANAHSDGVGADEQLLFAEPLPKGAHLERMSALCALALDTLHYNSHTTGADALWTGTPLVTLRGTSMASRVAASLSHATGVMETTVFSHREYADLTVALLRAPRRRPAPAAA